MPARSKALRNHRVSPLGWRACQYGWASPCCLPPGCIPEKRARGKRARIIGETGCHRSPDVHRTATNPRGNYSQRHHRFPSTSWIRTGLCGCGRCEARESRKYDNFLTLWKERNKAKRTLSRVPGKRIDRTRQEAQFKPRGAIHVWFRKRLQHVKNRINWQRNLVCRRRKTLVFSAEVPQGCHLGVTRTVLTYYTALAFHCCGTEDFAMRKLQNAA